MIILDNKNDKNNYQPDITNYDYVWGSDQDQYVKEKPSAEESAKQAAEQEQE